MLIIQMVYDKLGVADQEESGVGEYMLTGALSAGTSVFVGLVFSLRLTKRKK